MDNKISKNDETLREKDGPSKAKNYSAGKSGGSCQNIVQSIPGGRTEEREEGPRIALRRNPERKGQREEASLPTTSKRRSTSAPLFPDEPEDQINAEEIQERTTIPSKSASSEWRVAKTRNKRTRDRNSDEKEKKKEKKSVAQWDKKQSLPRATRSAVLVKPGVGQTYADVLQKLKTNVNLTETNVEVRLNMMEYKTTRQQRAVQISAGSQETVQRDARQRNGMKQGRVASETNNSADDGSLHATMPKTRHGTTGLG